MTIGLEPRPLDLESSALMITPRHLPLTIYLLRYFDQTFCPFVNFACFKTELMLPAMRATSWFFPDFCNALNGLLSPVVILNKWFISSAPLRIGG